LSCLLFSDAIFLDTGDLRGDLTGSALTANALTGDLAEFSLVVAKIKYF